MILIRLILQGRLLGHLSVPIVPNAGDRIVLARDAYTGYIVTSRQFKEGDTHVTVNVRLDK